MGSSIEMVRKSSFELRFDQDKPANKQNPVDKQKKNLVSPFSWNKVITVMAIAGLAGFIAGGAAVFEQTGSMNSLLIHGTLIGVFAAMGIGALYAINLSFKEKEVKKQEVKTLDNYASNAQLLKILLFSGLVLGALTEVLSAHWGFNFRDTLICTGAVGLLGGFGTVGIYSMYEDEKHDRRRGY